MKAHRSILLILITGLTTQPHAHPEQAPTITALKQRIQQLEQQLNPLLKAQEIQRQARMEPTRAFQRILADADRYSRIQLHTIEQLYKQAAKDWSTPAAAEALNILQKKYPHANRTGCALLRHAQQLNGDSKKKQLQQIIAQHTTAYFPDGVNIGAFARLTLALHHRQQGNTQAAQEQINHLQQHHPHAIDHQGQLLLDHFNELENILPY
jgi:hypothetical protein